jgi:hypothetical protein
MTTVATAFGISSVALKKTCKKLNIPTPPRGYWAKLAVGLKLPQEPLPPAADAATVEFDVKANTQRREEIRQQRAILPPDGPPRLSLSADCSKLHPVIADLLRLLKTEKPDYEGLVCARDSRLPTVTVPPGSIDRVVRALNALFEELQNRGIPFTIEKHRKEGAFRRGEDAICVTVQEPFETIEREPTLEEKKRPSWEWKTKTRQPSGKLRIRLVSSGYIHGKADWTESPRNPLEVILWAVADRIAAFFPEQDERRKRAEEERLTQQEADRVRQEQQRKAAHEHQVAMCASKRLSNLVRAAEWCRLYVHTQEFIAASESRWREAGAGTLTPQQEEWLSWARGEAKALAPEALGYPQLPNDGKLDPTSIPFGGPYPETRMLPIPPTLDKAPPPERSSHTWDAPAPQPYPFWLKYQR